VNFVECTIILNDYVNFVKQIRHYFIQDIDNLRLNQYFLHLQEDRMHIKIIGHLNNNNNKLYNRNMQHVSKEKKKRYWTTRHIPTKYRYICSFPEF